jgi:membrane fusion protein (multidrug efflux system)
MIKRFIIALVLIIVVCGGLVGFNIFRANAIKQFFATMQRPAIVVSTITVQPAAWTPGVEAFGTVYAAEGTDVAVQSGGVVKDVLFKPNDQIKEGQVLVQIDDAVERADLLAAQTAVDNTRRAIERARTLAKSGVNSPVTVETAEGNLDTALSQLNKIEATLDQKAIKARFDGIVGIAKVTVGQYVQPGTVVATLQNLDKMKVDFTVPEQVIGSLKIGQPAKFGLTEDDMSFSGNVIGIDPKVDPQTRLVSVQALIDNSTRTLRPGQFIRIRVQLPQEDNIVALPQTAVVSSLYGDYVFAVEQAKADATPAAPNADNKPAEPKLIARQIFVKLGRRNAGEVEIVEGVKGGDDIVTAGQNRLSNGATVKVDNTVDPTKANVRLEG